MDEKSQLLYPKSSFSSGTNPCFCLLWRRRTSKKLPPAYRKKTFRFVSPEQLVFLLGRERASVVSSDGEPLPRPRQRALPRPRRTGAWETEASGDEYGQLPRSTGESHGGGGGRSLLRRAQLRSAVTQLQAGPPFLAARAQHPRSP